MHTTLLGEISRPAVATLGTWDPFFVEHDRMLAELVGFARHRDAPAMAILLDPPPAVFNNGPQSWPRYHGLQTRLQLLRRTGVDAVMIVHFTEADLKHDAKAFFDLVCGTAPLGHFWLRHSQTIGSGSRGGGIAILAQSVKRKFELTWLPSDALRAQSSVVRGHLAAGAISCAAAMVGRFPSIDRDERGMTQVAWPPGRYHALHGETSTDRPTSIRAHTEIELRVGDDGMSTFDWPQNMMDTIAFVAGPGDASVRGSLNDSALARVAGGAGIT